jgi:hypothetical protein
MPATKPPYDDALRGYPDFPDPPYVGGDHAATCWGCEGCAKAEDAYLASDEVARRFHEAYERLAPFHGYETRPESTVPWEQVPHANRGLMRAVVRALMDDGYIDLGPELRP